MYHAEVVYLEKINAYIFTLFISHFFQGQICYFWDKVNFKKLLRVWIFIYLSSKHSSVSILFKSFFSNSHIYRNFCTRQLKSFAKYKIKFRLRFFKFYVSNTDTKSLLSNSRFSFSEEFMLVRYGCSRNFKRKLPPNITLTKLSSRTNIIFNQPSKHTCFDNFRRFV